MHPVSSIFSDPYNRGCFAAACHLFFALFLLLFETLSLALDFVEVVWCEGGYVVFRFGLLPCAGAKYFDVVEAVRLLSLSTFGFVFDFVCSARWNSGSWWLEF
jgi:hypothetical protein